MTNAVILAEPDAYDIDTGVLMGRHSAGYGFLRAAVRARGDSPIYGRSPSMASVPRFKQILESIEPGTPFKWVHPDRLEEISKVGVIQLADPNLAKYARMRLRAGIDAFSICGITHTTASHSAMDMFLDLLREPTAPWDALICTSTSVVETIRRIQEAERDYHRWRYGAEAAPLGPQLPIIPLGVHCDDFVFSEDARAAARAELGIAADETAGLFVGRLVFHAKAHPFPILRAFQLASERTGKKLTLIFCGWFPNRETEEVFRAGAASYAPDVKVLYVDGRARQTREQAWAGADIFVSPSDNIQETFGIAPVEAMAAGLPVVVSDYDGYRDTIRQAVDGFRIKTWAPEAGAGDALARAFETELFDYNYYCWGAAQLTAVEIEPFVDAVAALVEQPQLRQKMGAAGRARARETYDWRVVYRQYQDLWADLNARRASAAADPALAQWVRGAPAAAPSRQDPFHIFGHYPTGSIDLGTTLSQAPGATLPDLKAALGHPLFSSLIIPVEVVERLFGQLGQANVPLAAAAAAAGVTPPAAMRAAGLLLKMGLARVEPPAR